MIKVRLNVFSNKELDFPQIEKESLLDIFERFWLTQKLEDNLLKNQFKIFINGEEVDKKMWCYIRPKPDVLVLIALTPASGSGNVFGQILVIAAVAAAMYFTGGAVGAGAMSSLTAFGINSAVAIGASLLVNSLIPPPDMGISIGSGYSNADSQMYSITSQSNAVAKYGSVPRVYGSHRIFPNVAANPYTEIEVDVKTGKLVQFLYCIYDFGYGPLVIRDIRIGDTQINEYREAYYRFVDTQKPEVAEGDWDNSLNTSFAYYKGDVVQNEVSASINKGQQTSGALQAEYEATRTSDSGSNGDKQEIVLVFACPKGLYTFSSSGKKAERNIELQIEFAPTGTNNWKNYDSKEDCFSWNSVGDSTSDDPDELPLHWFPGDLVKYYPLHDVISEKILSFDEMKGKNTVKYGFITNFFGIGFALDGMSQYVDDGYTVDELHGAIFYEIEYGFRKGTKIFYSQKLISINSYISHGGEIVGRIKTRAVHSGLIYKYTMFEGFPYDISYFTGYTREMRVDNGFGTGTIPDYRQAYTESVATFFGSGPPTLRAVLRLQGGSGLLKIKATSQEPVYSSVRFSPKTNEQIDIRVTRVRSFGGHTYQITEDLAWTSLSTRFMRATVNSPNRHVFMEVKIRATDQLNGTINNLSAKASSVLDVYNPDTQTWSKQETNNPAWVYADLLTGTANKNRVAKSRLDTDSLLEWAEFCEEIPAPPASAIFFKPRFECNFILDYKVTLQNILNQVSRSAQASLNVINGKYGILIDKYKSVPVQLFTPRNSWGFQSSRSYSETPTALRVKFVDAGLDWNIGEKVVYADGYVEETADTFEELDTFGCTNHEQAWRYGRYMLAQAKLRQENISIMVDFEHLVCTRGDFVKLQYDIMKVGGTPCRVKTVVGNKITTNDNFVTVPDTSYGYIFRNASGIFEGTMVILNSDEANLTGDLPEEGDLLVWGELERTTIDCIVKSITPNDDLSATLLLVEKADAIYDAESTDTIPSYDPMVSSRTTQELFSPGAVASLAVVANDWACGAGAYVYFISLSWLAPADSVVEKYEVYVDYGRGYVLAGYASNLGYQYIVSVANLSVAHNFKVIGVSSTGAKIDLGAASVVSATPISKATAPSNIDALYINILGETLQLDWETVSDCDIGNYLIRYSPNINAKWESSIPLQTVDRNTSLATFQARTGAYFIKAVDWNGNESVVTAQAATAIPELTNLNIIEETDDFPDLLGVKENVEAFGDSLVLSVSVAGDADSIQYQPDGFYYFKNLLDLGEIYSCRIQSLIQAEGYTPSDVMANWVTLADVEKLANTRTSEWSVETYYRARESFNTIAQWVTMASIPVIAEGEQGDWTPWRKFTIGDFTGRIFQFRLKLISNKPSVSPRVFSGVIRADMPDRMESFNNEIAPNTGLTLTYPYPFKGPGASPSIQITQDDMEKGDYFKITAKTLSGFTITFYDEINNPVERQFDAHIKGYGRLYSSIL